MQKTGIEWATDVWNPIVGCSKISTGCKNCYAEKFAKRLAGNGVDGYEAVRGWDGRTAMVDGKLGVPLHRKKSRRIFVCSMSDLFHESTSNEDIAAVFGVMAASPDHVFIVLTKRPVRMREWFAWIDRFRIGVNETSAVVDQANVCGRFAVDALPAINDAFVTKFLSTGRPWPLSNVWLGVSVEDQKTADERIPILLQIPAAVRWVSYEPALGAVDWYPFVGGAKPRIDWLVAGAETGQRKRPADNWWFTLAASTCQVNDTPFFFKVDSDGNHELDGVVHEDVP